MVNFSIILMVIGILLVVLSVAMIVPAVVDFYAGYGEWEAFAISAFLTAFIGMLFVVINRDKPKDISLKQAFILTTLSWVILVAFAAIPFTFANHNISYTDAFFEAMSGLTTTGATVMTGLDNMPPGFLIWRSILQWLGGIGIIVLAMAIFPMLKIGGMQLFRTESSDKSDKILPRATQVSGAIGGIYIFLTVVCGVLLWMAGMPVFDAICHAMTTIATSGFSTHDQSIGYFDSATIEMIMVCFMILSGIPFVLYIQVLRGRPLVLWRDTQVRWFLAMLSVSVVVIALWLALNNGVSWGTAFRQSLFNVVSIFTTTGFTSADYYGWGSFAIVAMFLTCVIGGCTGSTTGGIKVFRFQVLFETVKAQVNHLIQPHGVFMPQFNKKPINESVTSSVMSFIILFAFCFSAIAYLLALTGLDFITSMSAAASAMANLGPGLGDVIGPTGNYSSLTDFAKWVMSVGMLVGRLEIFTVLILLSPYFWKS